MPYKLSYSRLFNLGNYEHEEIQKEESGPSPAEPA